MMVTASSSIERRTDATGQGAPVTCSLRRSPVPSPRKNRPGSNEAAVAAACATTAGCIRWIGAVTPVPTSSSSVAMAMAPSTPHTKGLSPWAGTHGW
jgi:hypothetical protein